MKKFVLMMMAVVCVGYANGQNLQEWVSQKSTQKKYLLQQIAYLQLYMGYVKKGYKIVKGGLNTISDWKGGEFKLHDNHFNSLNTVNPNIRKSNNVKGIKDLQRSISKKCELTQHRVKEGDALNAREVYYVNGVFERLLQDCNGILAELIAVTSNGKLEMTDDERITKIDELYRRMQDNYSFTVAFCADVEILMVRKREEKADIRRSRIWNGITD